MLNTANPSTNKRLALSGTSLSFFLILVHMGVDGYSSMFSAMLPTLEEKFSLSKTNLAMLVATLSLSTSFVQPLFGSVADRFGRRATAAFGALLIALLLSLMGVMPTVPLLFLCLLFGGLGSAAFHPAGTSIARESGKNKGLAVGLFSFGGTIGLAIGPLVALFIIANFGLQWTPIVMIPGVILALLMFLLVPKVDMSQVEKRKFFDLSLFNGPVGLLAIVGILRSITYVTFASAMPLWLVSQGIARDSSVIGWTLALSSFSAGFGGILAGYLTPYLNKQILITGTMVAALPVFLMIFHVEIASVAFYGLIMLGGILLNAGLPLMIVSAQDLAPHAIGTASGIMMGFSWGSAGLFYILVGRLQEVIGLQAAMSMAYCLLIPGAILAFYIFRRYKDRLVY